MRFLYRRLPKTLSARFLLIIVLPIFLWQALTIFLFFDRHWYNVSFYSGNLIATQIKDCLDEYEKTKVPKKKFVEDYFGVSYIVEKNENLNLKQRKISEELQIFKNILNLKINLPNVIKQGEDGKIRVFFPLSEGRIVFYFPKKILISPTTYIFVAWSIGLGITVLALSLFFSRKQISSILELTSAIDSFGKKEPFSYKPSGAAEVRKAGLAFLKMRDRIKKYISRRTQTLAMISHDLRTPLTRIKLRLELLDDGDEAKGEIAKDVDIMVKTVNSYLDFARGEDSEDFESVEINSWLEENIVKQFKGANIVLRKSRIAVSLPVKSFSLQRALSNLVENAIKYASEIKISVKDSENKLEIIIEDDGPGIRDEEKPLVARPFYRTEKTRPTGGKLSGVGLGLAIAKEIIESQGGKLYLEDSKDLGGLSVRIDFPKN